MRRKCNLENHAMGLEMEIPESVGDLAIMDEEWAMRASLRRRRMLEKVVAVICAKHIAWCTSLFKPTSITAKSQQTPQDIQPSWNV